MPELNEVFSERPATKKIAKSRGAPFHLPALIVSLLVLVSAFGRPLYELFSYSLHSTLYSHIPIIPLISFYLFWLKKSEVRAQIGRGSRWTSLGFALGGAGVLAFYWIAVAQTVTLAKEDAFFLLTASFLLFFVAICGWFFGGGVLRAAAFPLSFLAFMLPFPTIVNHGIETFLQHGSAWVALGFFKISGMPVFNESLVFQLPGFSMRVAPECSGIHSTLALFITSMVAGRLFLRTKWKHAVLALFVIPLALVRNGFRVFVIGQLCVRISPDMIHSYIHRQGGPIFFALSLIPFTIVLWILIRSERRAVTHSSPKLS